MKTIRNTEIIENLDVVKYNEPITIYNFVVEDFHTYYVGESKMLVNFCPWLDDAVEGLCKAAP